MTVFAIKIGKPGAITFGQDRMMISEIFSSSKAITASGLRQRLDELAELIPPEVIYIDRRQMCSSKKQPFTECVARFAESQGVKVVEVGVRRYRSRFAGHADPTAVDVAEAAERRSLYPRNQAEADCFALFKYGLDEFFRDA